MRILIVDDEPVLRTMVRLTLEDVHEVREAADGPGALEPSRSTVHSTSCCSIRRCRAPPASKCWRRFAAGHRPPAW